MAAAPDRGPTTTPPGDPHVDGTGEMPAAVDLDRLETILERQVEEVAYESTLRTTTDVLPGTLRKFLA